MSILIKYLNLHLEIINFQIWMKKYLNFAFMMGIYLKFSSSKNILNQCSVWMAWQMQNQARVPWKLPIASPSDNNSTPSNTDKCGLGREDHHLFWLQSSHSSHPQRVLGISDILESNGYGGKLHWVSTQIYKTMHK